MLKYGYQIIDLVDHVQKQFELFLS